MSLISKKNVNERLVRYTSVAYPQFYGESKTLFTIYRYSFGSVTKMKRISLPLILLLLIHKSSDSFYPQNNLF